ncbi:MAG: AAA family ATPase [Acidimicrobiales bacterium]|nr:AAA family ATPase [Acidimicrobiales bacterium]
MLLAPGGDFVADQGTQVVEAPRSRQVEGAGLGPLLHVALDLDQRRGADVGGAHRPPAPRPVRAPRLPGATGTGAGTAVDPTRDPADTLDEAKAALAAIEVPTGRLPADVWSVDEFVARDTADVAPWVVPGLLRVGWRCMVVAPEGVGKSWVTGQVAMCAAQGIHPFNFEPAPPVNTLIVDLENPDDAVIERCNLVRSQAMRVKGDRYREHAAWLWHRPGGIDLRSRAGRGELEAVVAHVAPALVCLGPLYKAYRVAASENDELAAGEVQHVLDDLRTRYRFALLVEHHAPKRQAGVRELAPYGSSLWLRWPELGLKLIPTDDTNRVMDVGRWRGDRRQSGWPARLERGTPWPWVGVWPDGWEPRNPR